MSTPNHTPDHNARTIGREWLIGSIAVAIAIASVILGRHFRHLEGHRSDALVAGAAVVLMFSGIYAVRYIARAFGRSIIRRSSLSAGATARLVIDGAGVVILIFGLFGVLGVSLQHLLIGAGVTGVIVGIAAQQSLANVFAAVVLLFARPFVVGERVRIRSGVLGVLDVEVLGAGLTYVTVRTEDGVLKIPNSVMLSSGIGRLSDDGTVHG